MTSWSISVRLGREDFVRSAAELPLLIEILRYGSHAQQTYQ